MPNGEYKQGVGSSGPRRPADTDNLDITVIMPALNEEKNILAAINNTLTAFEDFSISSEIVVVNDGSTDRTEELVSAVMERDKRVRMLKHAVPQGIGASFWDGVDNARGEAVVLLPGDNENDPWEIFRYYGLLEHVDIVIPFVYNRGLRSFFRNILSFIYRFIINSTFLVNFNYTNGTVLYRKSILKELDYRDKGFFFQTDILIRTVKRGYLFAEVPYRLGLRKEGVSRAVTFPSLLQVIRGYLYLVRSFYFKREGDINKSFAVDSLTLARRQSKQQSGP